MPATTFARRAGQERFFHEDEVIVSKTDPRGIITYANSVFLRVAGYTEDEVLGRPHNMIRHPEMPRSVFKLLWDKLKRREEVFAYVINQAKGGDYYWVFAHVTPSIGRRGDVVGYHSNRRVPARTAVSTISDIYRELLEQEQQHADRRAGMLAGEELLLTKLSSLGTTYEEFIFSL
jgi:PAS domain S-box-containing protein